MANVALHEFIRVNREELIARCKAKVATRSGPTTMGKGSNGVPLFLDQLANELRDGHSNSRLIYEGAVRHGRDLLDRGFTVSQVVHDYGDVCQSVTDLAVETSAPIETEDFRTLNRCLDDAIAGAVTEHARGQAITRNGQSQELRILTNTAIAAFDALLSGSVGIGGSTGAVLRRSLTSIAEFLDRPSIDGQFLDPPG